MPIDSEAVLDQADRSTVARRDCPRRSLVVRFAGCCVLPSILCFGAVAAADTLEIYPDGDATLIEEPDGALGNGSGPALFVGRTGQSRGGIRRALLRFDIAAVVPADAIIENVSLVLYLTPSHAVPVPVGVHRVLEAWSEGPSASAGGAGAGALPGDVTWLHADYDVALWARAGGHFVQRSSATIEVGDVGDYEWPGTPQLIADVRLWQHVPEKNHGWILLGDEEMTRSVKRFSSRETDEHPYSQPVLVIDYRRPGRW